MREDAVAAADLRVRDTRCHSWLAALKFCNVTLVAAKGDDAGERTLWYVFLGGADDQAMTPLRSRSDASHVTTSLGLETMHSRLITLLLFAAIVVLCIGVAAAMLRRGREAQRAFSAMSGQRLEPVVVEIERNNLMPPRRRLWVYVYQEGGRRERALAEWPSRQQPLFTSLDEKSALAIRGEEGGRPMLLDANLQCLDLTDAERAAFRVAFLARLARAPARRRQFSLDRRQAIAHCRGAPFNGNCPSRAAPDCRGWKPWPSDCRLRCFCPRLP